MAADHTGLWVRSDVLPSGAYGVTINIGDDHAWTLTPDAAIAYAATCVRRATEVEHDAAVISLTTHIGIPLKHAARLVTDDLRPNRPLDHTATEPLQILPVLGARTGPHLRLRLRGEPAGEVTPADLIDHAVGVLRVLAAADLDAVLRRTLVGQYGLDEQRARATVATLADHWPEQRPPRTALDPAGDAAC